MAKLPSNTFMFNYNAKQYDSTTKTFPKTTGQLFDEDLVLNNAITVGDGYVTFNQNSWMVKSYANANDNPFNVTSTNPYFTFIYKTSGWTSDDTNLIANRGSNFNFMMRANRCIFGTEYCIFSPTSNPQIVVIRANANASFSRQEWDENGNVLSAATATGYYGNTSNSMDFFCGMANGSENFRKTFYWMYCSRELLTDAEVLKVIQYNENPVSFSIDPETVTFGYDSGSTTVNITAEAGWTTSTSNSWITLSETEGYGDSSITVTVSDNYNNSANRIGTVSFTDGEEVLTLSIAQKADTRIILKNIYRSGVSVKQMFRNGVMIYKQFTKLTFNVDTDSITFDNTGGTYTINITANERWTMTIPNWVTASSLSGTGNAAITISTNSVPEEKLEGSIIINCLNKTHTISVVQHSAIHYVTSIHISNNFPVNNSPCSNAINTGIYPTSDFEIRVVYVTAGVQNGNRIVGFAVGEPDVSVRDSNDLRYFFTGNNYYIDAGNGRESKSAGSFPSGITYDLTYSNFALYDNINERYILSSSTKTFRTDVTIRADVGSIYLKRVQIKNNGVVQFDGYAAEDNGHIGLYDTVSGQLFYNPNLTMTYEE